MRTKILPDEKHEFQHECSEEEVTTKSIDGGVAKEKYVIDRLMDHFNEQGRWKFTVRWYGFASTDDTKEPTEGLPRSSVKRNLKRKDMFAWPPPDVSDQAIVR